MDGTWIDISGDTAGVLEHAAMFWDIDNTVLYNRGGVVGVAFLICCNGRNVHRPVF
jgi:hypothetical protein